MIDIVEQLRGKATDGHADEEALYREAADKIERLRALRDELVEMLDVLLRYVDEEAEDGMMQCVETQLARDTLAKARGEQT